MDLNFITTGFGGRNMIRLENVSKSYNDKMILENINFEVEQGDRVVILGKSGSGKTTLLNIIATIDSNYSGNVYLFNNYLSKLKKSDIAKLRRDQLGFIFQDFGLLENFNIEENILLPSRSAGKDIKKDEYFNKLIDVLNIENLLKRYPSELSGGEKQRAAIARAIIKKPKLVVADEITSALDIYTSKELIIYLDEVVTKFNITLLMVTHDLEVARVCNKAYFIKHGHLVELDNLSSAEKLFYQESNEG